MSVRHRWVELEETAYGGREFSWLWLLAAATYGVGDIVTTVAVVWFSAAVEEANPIVQFAVESFGQAGLVGLKLTVFLSCIAISVDAARREDGRLLFYGPPLLLAVLGLFATVYNLRLLAV